MKLNKLAFISTLALAACFAHAETYALCMGVNEYGKVKLENGEEVDETLKGCVNDATSVRDILSSKYGVKAENVHLVTDKDVNVENFITEWKWVMSKAQKGDQVIFSFSGHGGRFESKDAVGGYQSVIVLQDRKLISGKFFNQLARIMANEKGINSTFIFDSCYSGGMSRDAYDGIQVRRKTLGNIRKKDGFSLASLKVADFGIARSRGVKMDTPASYAFLFAGKDDQPTSDVSGLKDIPAHGLFTLLMLSVLEDQPATPVKDLFGAVNGVLEQINKKLKDSGKDLQFEQKPNFESSSDDRSQKSIILN